MGIEQIWTLSVIRYQYMLLEMEICWGILSCAGQEKDEEMDKVVYCNVWKDTVESSGMYVVHWDE